jgi:hypothetical protein
MELLGPPQALKHTSMRRCGQRLRCFSFHSCRISSRVGILPGVPKEASRVDPGLAGDALQIYRTLFDRQRRGRLLDYK